MAKACTLWKNYANEERFEAFVDLLHPSQQSKLQTYMLSVSEKERYKIVAATNPMTSIAKITKRETEMELCREKYMDSWIGAGADHVRWKSEKQSKYTDLVLSHWNLSTSYESGAVIETMIKEAKGKITEVYGRTRDDVTGAIMENNERIKDEKSIRKYVNRNASNSQRPYSRANTEQMFTGDQIVPWSILELRRKRKTEEYGALQKIAEKIDKKGNISDSWAQNINQQVKDITVNNARLDNKFISGDFIKTLIDNINIGLGRESTAERIDELKSELSQLEEEKRIVTMRDGTDMETDLENIDRWLEEVREEIADIEAWRAVSPELIEQLKSLLDQVDINNLSADGIRILGKRIKKASESMSKTLVSYATAQWISVGNIPTDFAVLSAYAEAIREMPWEYATKIINDTMVVGTTGPTEGSLFNNIDKTRDLIKNSIWNAWSRKAQRQKARERREILLNEYMIQRYVHKRNVDTEMILVLDEIILIDSMTKIDQFYKIGTVGHHYANVFGRTAIEWKRSQDATIINNIRREETRDLLPWDVIFLSWVSWSGKSRWARWLDENKYQVIDINDYQYVRWNIVNKLIVDAINKNDKILVLVQWHNDKVEIATQVKLVNFHSDDSIQKKVIFFPDPKELNDAAKKQRKRASQEVAKETFASFGVKEVNQNFEEIIKTRLEGVFHHINLSGYRWSFTPVPLDTFKQWAKNNDVIAWGIIKKSENEYIYHMDSIDDSGDNADIYQVLAEVTWFESVVVDPFERAIYNSLSEETIEMLDKIKLVINDKEFAVDEETLTDYVSDTAVSMITDMENNNWIWVSDMNKYMHGRFGREEIVKYIKDFITNYNGWEKWYTGDTEAINKSVKEHLVHMWLMNKDGYIGREQYTLGVRTEWYYLTKFLTGTGWTRVSLVEFAQRKHIEQIYREQGTSRMGEIDHKAKARKDYEKVVGLVEEIIKKQSEHDVDKTVSVAWFTRALERVQAEWFTLSMGLQVGAILNDNRLRNLVALWVDLGVFDASMEDAGDIVNRWAWRIVESINKDIKRYENIYERESAERKDTLSKFLTIYGGYTSFGETIIKDNGDNILGVIKNIFEWPDRDIVINNYLDAKIDSFKSIGYTVPDEAMPNRQALVDRFKMLYAENKWLVLSSLVSEDPKGAITSSFMVLRSIGIPYEVERNGFSATELFAESSSVVEEMIEIWFDARRDTLRNIKAVISYLKSSNDWKTFLEYDDGWDATTLNNFLDETQVWDNSLRTIVNKLIQVAPFNIDKMLQWMASSSWVTDISSELIEGDESNTSNDEDNEDDSSTDSAITAIIENSVSGPSWINLTNNQQIKMLYLINEMVQEATTKQHTGTVKGKNIVDMKALSSMVDTDISTDAKTTDPDTPLWRQEIDDVVERNKKIENMIYGGNTNPVLQVTTSWGDIQYSKKSTMNELMLYLKNIVDQSKVQLPKKNIPHSLGLRPIFTQNQSLVDIDYNALYEYLDAAEDYRKKTSGRSEESLGNMRSYQESFYIERGSDSLIKLNNKEKAALLWLGMITNGELETLFSHGNSIKDTYQAGIQLLSVIYKIQDLVDSSAIVKVYMSMRNAKATAEQYEDMYMLIEKNYIRQFKNLWDNSVIYRTHMELADFEKYNNPRLKNRQETKKRLKNNPHITAASKIMNELLDVETKLRKQLKKYNDKTSEWYIKTKTLLDAISEYKTSNIVNQIAYRTMKINQNRRTELDDIIEIIDEYKSEIKRIESTEYSDTAARNNEKREVLRKTREKLAAYDVEDIIMSRVNLEDINDLSDLSDNQTSLNKWSLSTIVDTNWENGVDVNIDTENKKDRERLEGVRKDIQEWESRREEFENSWMLEEREKTMSHLKERESAAEDNILRSWRSIDYDTKLVYGNKKISISHKKKLAGDWFMKIKKNIEGIKEIVDSETDWNTNDTSNWVSSDIKDLMKMLFKTNISDKELLKRIWDIEKEIKENKITISKTEKEIDKIAHSMTTTRFKAEGVRLKAVLDSLRKEWKEHNEKFKAKNTFLSETKTKLAELENKLSELYQSESSYTPEWVSEIINLIFSWDKIIEREWEKVSIQEILADESLSDAVKANIISNAFAETISAMTVSRQSKEQSVDTVLYSDVLKASQELRDLDSHMGNILNRTVWSYSRPRTITIKKKYLELNEDSWNYGDNFIADVETILGRFLTSRILFSIEDQTNMVIEYYNNREKQNPWSRQLYQYTEIFNLLVDNHVESFMKDNSSEIKNDFLWIITGRLWDLWYYPTSNISYKDFSIIAKTYLGYKLAENIHKKMQKSMTTDDARLSRQSYISSQIDNNKTIKKIFSKYTVDYENLMDIITQYNPALKSRADKSWETIDNVRTLGELVDDYTDIFKASKWLTEEDVYKTKKAIEDDLVCNA